MFAFSRGPLIFIALALVASIARADEWFRFTAAECERHLKDTTRSPRLAHARGAEAVSWITATHPCVTRVLEGSDGLDLPRRFDVFFACTGYTLPPKDAVHLYDRGISYGFGRQAIARRLLRGNADQIHHDYESLSIGAKLVFMSTLLTRSFTILDAIVKGSFEQNVIRTGDLAGSTPAKGRVHLDLSKVFAPEDRRTLRDLVAHASKAEVRNSIVRLVDQHLDEIIGEQARLCGDLQRCESTDEFRRLLRIFRVGPEASGTTSPMRSEACPPPPPSLERELEVFFAAQTGVDPGEIDQRLGRVQGSLHDVLKLLNRGLTEFSRWRAEEPRMSGWKYEFDGTLDSIDRLSSVIEDFNVQTLRATERFRTAEGVVRRFDQVVRTWDAGLDALRGDAARVERLSPSDRARFASILNLEAQVSVLLMQTQASVELHRRRLQTRLETSALVGLIIGGALQAGLADEIAPGAPIAEARAEAIRAALDLIREEPELGDLRRRLGSLLGVDDGAA